MGEVKSRTNGNGYTTKYEYDALGQLTETIDPLERKTKQEYDAAGNLKKTEDALGRTVSYAYDNADRLKEVNYSEASTADITYKYDKNSNVVEMIDGTGTTTRVYDQLGRLTEVKNGKRSRQIQIRPRQPADRNRLSERRNRQTRIRQSRASRKRSPTGSERKPRSPITANSQMKAMTFPAATTNVDEYAYNRAGEMTAVSMKKKAEVLASMTYTRDKLGQVEKTVETGFPEVPEYKYEYDTANRLTKSNGTLFEYDAANNVTKISPTTYTYDKADQIATASNATFEFNKLGQRVKETPTGGSATTFSYDQAGKPDRKQRPGRSKTPSNTTVRACEPPKPGTPRPIRWSGTPRQGCRSCCAKGTTTSSTARTAFRSSRSPRVGGLPCTTTNWGRPGCPDGLSGNRDGHLSLWAQRGVHGNTPEPDDPDGVRRTVPDAHRKPADLPAGPDLRSGTAQFLSSDPLAADYRRNVCVCGGQSRQSHGSIWPHSRGMRLSTSALSSDAAAFCSSTAANHWST